MQQQQYNVRLHLHLFPRDLLISTVPEGIVRDVLPMQDPYWKSCKRGSKKIYFYTYETLPTCSKCGPKPKGTKECEFCTMRSEKGERKGKFGPRKILVLKHESFDTFWKDYYMPHLKKFRMHHWKRIVLSKKFLNDPREKALDIFDILLNHDFTEAMVITHNNEVQSSHFGASSSKVSIEGYTVLRKGKDQYDYVINLLDFHSFMSDNSVQEARTVFHHLEKLIKKLKDEGKLKDGSRILAVTDGCAKQYRSATSIYFMSVLAY